MGAERPRAQRVMSYYERLRADKAKHPHMPLKQLLARALAAGHATDGDKKRSTKRKRHVQAFTLRKRRRH